MIAVGLMELGFVPLVDFVAEQAAGGEVTLRWLSAQTQPSMEAIQAAAATAAQKQTAEATRVTAFRTSQERLDMLQRLRTATPTQISNFVDNQVAGSTAQQLAAIRTLLKAILTTIALDGRQ